MNKLAITVAFLALLSRASATTIIPMSVEQLTHLSSDVVVAHAGKTWSAWNLQHTRISTYTQFAVDSWLKGSGEKTITVQQPGGSAEGYTQHVAGVRPWSPGESAVLFLRPASERTGAFIVSGLMQGDFRVRYSASGAAVADNGIQASGRQIDDDVQTFNPRDKSFAPYTGSRLSLEELKQRVRMSSETR